MSEVVPFVQVTVEVLLYAGIGDNVGVPVTGIRLLMVNADELTAVPFAVPSLGVIWQISWSFLTKELFEIVDVVMPVSAPFLNQR
jgi:hypothetical protein